MFSLWRPAGAYTAVSTRCQQRLLEQARTLPVLCAMHCIAGQVFEEQLVAYAQLTQGLGGYANVLFVSPAMAHADPSGFVASGHTFRVHENLTAPDDPNPRVRPADMNPTSWDVDSSAGSRSRLPYGMATWGSANFTVPAVLSIDFTLHETWPSSATHTRAVWQRWEAWMAARLRDAPAGLQQGFQSSNVRFELLFEVSICAAHIRARCVGRAGCKHQRSFRSECALKSACRLVRRALLLLIMPCIRLQSWRLMEQQDVMFNSGVMSLALSLFLACLTLVLVTGNLVLAGLASACITAVVVVFMGAMQLLGWTLGAHCSHDWSCAKFVHLRGGCMRVRGTRS